MSPADAVLRFDSLDSTNAEALRRAAAGHTSPLWVVAAEQTAGRGRAGRSWASIGGNLHASLLMRPECGLETALQLSLVSALAAHMAVTDIAAGRLDAPLTLKWPNDLLLGGAKVGGILLESAGQGGALAVAIGFGLNVAAHPSDVAQPATDLAAHGLKADPDTLLEALVAAAGAYIEMWDAGRDFDAIRSQWERRAPPLGEPIRVRLAKGELVGTYGGVDCDGALRLIEPNGALTRVSAGDVFLA